MDVASLIGFGLVLLSVSIVSSVVLGGLLLLGKDRLRTMGPWAERRAASLALLLPPLYGLGVVITIAVTKVAAWQAGTDHCLGHSHHLHLCPIHGGHWATVPWAVAATAFFATYVLTRIAMIFWAHANAQRSANRLKRSGTPIIGFERAVLVPSSERFAFTTGVYSPAVIISSATWEAIDEDQRHALLAHEYAHIAHGDLWKRATLGILACFGAPVLSQRSLKIWELASERVCDRDAAELAGRPSVVASAMLSLVQTRTNRHEPAIAGFAAECNVTERIQSLFNTSSGGKRAAKRIAVALLLTSVLAAVTCVFCSESLHHTIETILG